MCWYLSNTIFSYTFFMKIFNANTVWYMILYTDTMCMIPEWLYVNLISLLGNSVMPLALFTGNKKKGKLCSSYYALISKIDNLPYCGELFFVSFVPSSSLSCYAPVDTPTHIFIANFILFFSSFLQLNTTSSPKHLFFRALPQNKCILKSFWSFGVRTNFEIWCLINIWRLRK